MGKKNDFWKKEFCDSLCLEKIILMNFKTDLKVRQQNCKKYPESKFVRLSF